ncbi:FMN-dependent NADH-azoreductase [[Mycoplasma] anseris]|uniref:FMN dependent NADH:quinone oxidoreductase n=1 Tax=[Mycoplasma] anseris TaxID=92400 RepID=A0A2Z4NCN1_9BACT|nr:FMN-dependent NADH-azoreductase [[Mycoplasma] anseris]AWX69324.1 FMN-dependent NADH-azoreductase [[Mycoplasma] anseris]
MKKILVLYSSPSLKTKSSANFFANKFIEEYQRIHPENEIKFYDLNELKMANITLNSLNMNNFFNQEDSLNYINELKSFDKLIIITSMTNFNIPAVLKNYIDHICLANETFSYKYSKKGDAIGLLDNLTVQIIATQGAPKGWYPWGDHVAYLEGTCKFLGMKINPSILIAGTKLKAFSEKTLEQHYEEFKQEFISKAKTF